MKTGSGHKFLPNMSSRGHFPHMSSDENGEDYRMNRATLKFRSTQLEKDYTKVFFKDYRKRFRVVVFGSFCITILAFYIYFTEDYEHEYQKWITVGLTILSLVVLPSALLLSWIKFFNFENWTRYFTEILYFSPPVVIFLLICVSYSMLYCDRRVHGSAITAPSTLAFSLLLPGFIRTNYFSILIILCVILIPFMNPQCFLMRDFGVWAPRFFSEIIFTVFAHGFAILLNYVREVVYRKTFVLDRKISILNEKCKTEQKKTNDLIKNVIPKMYVKNVRKSLRKREKNKWFTDLILCEEQEKVTILITDYVNFTEFSSKVSANVLVKILNIQYSAMDRICLNNQCEKIKTIGDSFFCLKFDESRLGKNKKFNETRRRNAYSLCKVADEIIDEVKFLNDQHGWDFHIRGGIAHDSGHITVFGNSQITFDVIGRSKVIAEFLEETCEEVDTVVVDANVYSVTRNLVKYSDAIAKFHPLLGEMRSYQILEVDPLIRSTGDFLSVDSSKSLTRVNSTQSDDSRSSLEEPEDVVRVVGKEVKVKLRIIEYLLATEVSKDFFTFERGKGDSNIWKLRILMVVMAAVNMTVFLITTYLHHCFQYVLPYSICNPRNLYFWIFFAVSIITQIILTIVFLLVIKKWYAGVIICYIVVVLSVVDSYILLQKYSDFFAMFYLCTIGLFSVEVIGSTMISFASAISILLTAPQLIIFPCNTSAKAVVLSVPVFFFSINHFMSLTSLKMFKKKKKLEKEIERNRKDQRRNLKLILSFLPKQIIEKVTEFARQSFYVDPDGDQEKFTAKVNRSSFSNEVVGCVMFCSVDGFFEYYFEHQEQAMTKKIAKSKKVLNILRFLNSLYIKFDKFCEKNDIVKIKSNGNVYLATVYSSPINHHIISEAAMYFVKVFNLERKQYNLEDDEDFGIKIGIHSGKFNTCVLGLTKYLFDIFGAPVNYSFRCCSGCEQGKILVSSDFKDGLQRELDVTIENSNFKTTNAGKTFLKGIGDEETFWLEEITPTPLLLLEEEYGVEENAGAKRNDLTIENVVEIYQQSLEEGEFEDTELEKFEIRRSGSSE